MSKQDELNQVFKDSFMAPQIEFDDYYEVDTSDGLMCVPSDVVSIPRFKGTISEDEQPLFSHYVSLLEDFVLGEIYTIEHKRGWLARLSASGYTDCTEWSAFDSFEEAADFLIDTYGDET